MTLIDSDSDEEFEIARQLVLEGEGSSSRGSSKNTRRFIRRDRLQAHQNLFRDYFADPPIYPHKYFRRRFRMSRPLFLRIQAAVEAHEPYFVQRRDSSGRLGFSSLQKITVALRILAYGVAADFMNEYLKIGETTALRSLKMFVKAVVSIFSEEYLRKPNNDDIVRLLAVGEKRGFPGMLGSIDCMHWKWKNCPTAWHGMYSGHIHEPTIILEAVASYDLWIWHAFFGLSGSHNDINVLDRSFIFSDLAQGRTPTVNYTINGHNYAMGYYLADGIYPQWATFVKTISAPQGNKKKYFAAAQESARKDVEHAFGVLQARFAIIRGPARFFHIETLNEIMMACIILHNMIIEDERADNGEEEFEYDQLPETYNDPVSTGPTPEFSEFIQRHHALRDRRIHSQLQTDLVEHLWQQYSAA
ncbi:uncharacterized protein LOC122296601 [Carya illinoinensis]|uniref:uncharacterized protein LOC122296601 n=1 Tax=Carya illinoinensis TaxID=32201 RepID=UPI001C722DF3|nr:uncharacterized protein LOC122296601 [Carya illinoinensis]